MVKTKGPFIMSLIAGITAIITGIGWLLLMLLFGVSYGGGFRKAIGALFGIPGVFIALQIVLGIVLIIFSSWTKNDAKAKTGNILSIIIGGLLIFPFLNWISGGLAIAAGIWGFVANK